MKRRPIPRRRGGREWSTRAPQPKPIKTMAVLEVDKPLYDGIGSLPEDYDIVELKLLDNGEVQAVYHDGFGHYAETRHRFDSLDEAIEAYRPHTTAIFLGKEAEEYADELWEWVEW